MGKKERPSLAVVNNFPPGEVEQFQFMTVGQRLRWLETANAFVNKVVNREKRALFDDRFKDLPTPAKRRRRKKRD